jgi:hypothetical protein
MPRYTLLDMVQSIMSDMNEDLINSIDDTQTGDMVARIVRDTYYDMINSRLWPTHAQLSTLTPSTDDNYPTPRIRLLMLMGWISILKLNSLILMTS